MNNKYFADKIIELLNKELEVNELRERLIAIVNEVRSEEREKHLTKGAEEYKRIDVENTLRVMPERPKPFQGGEPAIATFTNEGRVERPDKIEEL